MRPILEALLLVAMLDPSRGRAGDSSFEMNGLQIGINEQTGAVTSLRAAPAGTLLQAASGDAGLLDVAYPVEHFIPMRLGAQYSTARVEKSPDRVVITWDTLGPSRQHARLPSGSVWASVVFRKAGDGRSVIASCRIENRSGASIPQILFPDFHGFLPVAGQEQTQLRLPKTSVYPFAEPSKAEEGRPYYGNGASQAYPPSDYYGVNQLRWLDFGGRNGGISILHRKWGTWDAPTVRTFRSEKDPARLRLMWEHRFEIAPGATWESGEFWLTPHPGGWAKGIEVFRRYVQSVNPARELPSHVRDGLGYQSVWMTQILETDPARADFRFQDLARIAADARRHGITELVPWGLFEDGILPVPLRPELGTLEEFLAGSRRAKEMGVNVAPFLSLCVMLNSQVARYGAKAHNGNWTYHPDLIPNFRPYYTVALEGGFVDAGNPVWQQDVKAELEGWLKRGVYSFSWDGFTNRRGDAYTKGALWKGGNAHFTELVQEIRRRARLKDPESTFSGEPISDLSFEEDSNVVDYTWNWVGYVDAGPILNVMRVPRLNAIVEASPLLVKKSFAEGLYLNLMPRKPDGPNGSALIGDVPALSKAVMLAAQLRSRYLPYFTQGVALGDSFLSQPSGAFVRAHQAGGKLLVFVLNDQEKAIDPTLRSDLHLWLPAASSYRVTSFEESGRMISTRRIKGAEWEMKTHDLQPEELRVLEIEPVLSAGNAAQLEP